VVAFPVDGVEFSGGTPDGVALALVVAGFVLVIPSHYLAEFVVDEGPHAEGAVGAYGTVFLKCCQKISFVFARTGSVKFRNLLYQLTP
jgi:hypothetical protein